MEDSHPFGFTNFGIGLTIIVFLIFGIVQIIYWLRGGEFPRETAQFIFIATIFNAIF